MKFKKHYIKYYTEAHCMTTIAENRCKYQNPLRKYAVFLNTLYNIYISTIMMGFYIGHSKWKFNID